MLDSPIVNINFKVKTTKDTVSILKNHIAPVSNLIQIDVQGLRSDDEDSIESKAKPIERPPDRQE